MVRHEDHLSGGNLENPFKKQIVDEIPEWVWVYVHQDSLVSLSGDIVCFHDKESAEDWKEDFENQLDKDLTIASAQYDDVLDAAKEFTGRIVYIQGNIWRIIYAN